MTRLFFTLSTVFLCSAWSLAAASDEVPGAPQTKPVALTNAVVHTIQDRPLARGTLLFENGVITAVGAKVNIPKGAQVIDLDGQHVYPGLIESMSQIGLREVSAVRASVDDGETGRINPNVKAHIAFNPDSEVIPVTRANGVLVAMSAPVGGRVSGYASVMQLDGWTWEQMMLKAGAGLMVNWPYPGRNSSSEDLEELRDLIEDARAYHAARRVPNSDQAFDIRLDALAPVLNGSTPLIAAANDVRSIQAAVAFAQQYELKLIIFGGHDAEQCADLLKRHDIPVIIDSVLRRPRRRHEPYDAAYTLAARLSQRGVKFCISGCGREETWNSRNLPYHAAMAAAHGLSYAEALRSVTQYPAEILGLADRLGTLEVGKDATLIVTSGDPLEINTQVHRAWVQGRVVQLSSRHTRLNDKYEQKYEQLQQSSQQKVKKAAAGE